MVQWRGDIDEKAGEKARKLDSLRGLEVPNFFVLTRDEVRSGLESRDPEVSLSSELKQRLNEAYSDIGVSSEVRNASGQARDLVGGHRESQRVSVRVSDDSFSDYRLNVGASGLEDALKQVLASHFQETSDVPAVIFQKMVEPEYTGSVISNYTRNHSLVEVVEGLGYSLEEGDTVPEFTLLENRSVVDTRIPDRQVKVTRNPMNGQRRTRKVSKDGPAFQENEIEELVSKTKKRDVSVKFAYKRGTFYIVDAFENNPMDVEPDLEALKVSEGEITGEEGRDYVLNDKPERTRKPQVSRSGGFVSTAAQFSRNNNVPAVFSLKDDSKLHQEDHQSSENPYSSRESSRKFNTDSLQVASIQVRGIREFPQLSGNPFGLGDTDNSFASSCEDVLTGADLLDARNIDEKAVSKLLDSCDLRAVVLENPSDKLLYSAVKNDLEMLVVPEKIRGDTEKKVLRCEKKFILDSLRN